jgi:hypothetical protein
MVATNSFQHALEDLKPGIDTLMPVGAVFAA